MAPWMDSGCEEPGRAQWDWAQRDWAQWALIGAAAMLLGACASGDAGYREGPLSISIPYDPYDFDPDDLQAEANTHCSAYDLRAVYVDETIDQQSVRWRYRHFDCV